MAEVKRCDICGREYNELAVRICPHPTVNRRYGEYICVWCCKRCRHHEEDNMTHTCVYEGVNE